MTLKINMKAVTKRRIRNFVKENMGRETSHDYSHAFRVGNIAMCIAEREGLEKPSLYEIAGLLHDIGLGLCERPAHGEVGAQMAQSFLFDIAGKEMTLEEITEVVYAISWHNHKKLAPRPSQLLDVLVDADTLDLLGAVGIWRGLAARPEKELGFSVAKILPTIENARYDTISKSKRENNSHDLMEQLSYQISCADILSTKTAKLQAEPLLSFMGNFRYMLAHELSMSNHE